MKKIIALLGLISILLCGCDGQQETADIAATTLPVYQFASILCEGTGLTVTRLVTENVSCLHDYSLSVKQVKAVERADVVVLSGGGLEHFMEDLLSGKQTLDASKGIDLLEACHEHDHSDAHHHEADVHIWLSPENAQAMATNICKGLSALYPQHKAAFEANLADLLQRLQDLLDYGRKTLSELSCRKLVTFHDGFSYFAHSFDLHILKAIEEESGSEASAGELKEVIGIVGEHNLPAIFVERSGADAAARIISREIGVPIFALDMAISGEDYFEAMYQNINTIKEALG